MNPTTPSGSGSGATPSSAALELATRLMNRLPELAVRLRDALIAKDEIYATTDLITPDELLRSCEHNLLRAVQSLAGTAPDDVDMLDAARRTARGRADAGLPLESLLHAYRLGTEVLWAALLEEAREHAPPLLWDLLDSAAQVMQVIDWMSLEAASVYRARVEQAQRRDSERRQAVLDGLLEGYGGDPRVAEEANRVLGVSPAARLLMVVIKHVGVWGSPPQSPADALAAHGFTSEWRLRADREIGLVVLGSESVARMTARLRAVVDGQAGMSSPFTGLEQVPSGCRLAELALDTIPGDEPMVVAFEDRLPEALLASNRTIADRIHQRALGRLLELDVDKRDMLLDTLRCWFRHDRSARDVACELHCHRNTVLQRLARIEDRTGRSLSNDRDVLLLRLALMTE